MASFGAKYPYFNPVAEEPEGKLPVYKDQEPVRVGRLVKADLTVNLASGKLFADDSAILGPSQKVLIKEAFI